MNTNPKNDGAHAADERLDEVRRTAPPSGGGLTNAQINERIAIALGTNRTDNIYAVKTFNLPNYAGSLDDCRWFENGLDSKRYSDNLKCVIQDRRCIESAIDARYLTATATPLERCEAFLRMKGQWE